MDKNNPDNNFLVDMQSAKLRECKSLLSDLGYSDSQVEVIYFLAEHMNGDIATFIKSAIDHKITGVLENPQFFGEKTSETLLRMFKKQ